MDVRGFGLSEQDLEALGYRVRSPGAARPRGTGGPEPAAARARPRDPAWRWWLATLLVLAAATWGSSLSRSLPAATPAAAPESEFSSARAMARLVEIARAPRPVGSPEHRRVREYLIARLTEHGLAPAVHTTTVAVRDGTHVRSATVRNVSATIAGVNRAAAPVVLMARYDGAPGTVGAGAYGVGVATLVEAARALAAGPPPRGDVVVAFVDAGALGRDALLGRLAEERGETAAPVVLSVDARGGRGPAIPIERGAAPGRLAEALVATGVAAPWHSVAEPLLRSPGTIGSALPTAAGVEIVTSWPASRDPSRDAAEHVSERTLQGTGGVVLAAARSLAGGGLDAVARGGERVHLTVPFAGTVLYGVRWVLPTTLALVLAWLLALKIVRARGGGLRGSAAGLVLAAAVVGGAAAMGRGMLDLLGPLHPELGALETAFYHEGPHVLALAILTLGLATLCLAVARRRVRSDELLVGALAVPVGVAAWVALRTPQAAPAVQGPLAVALLAVLVVVLAGPARARAAWAWLIVVTLSAALLMLAMPGLEIAAAAWTFRKAVRLGALLGLLAVLLLPALGWLTAPRAWWTPAVSLAVAGALVTLALPAVRGSVDHPVPTSLVYLTEAPVATGSMVSRAVDVERDTSGVRTMAGEWLIVPGPGERWARSWVAEPPAGPLEAGTLLVTTSVDAGALADGAWERAGGAPDSELAAPRARVVRATPEGDRLRVDLTLRRGLVGEAVGVAVPAGIDIEIAGVGDATWPAGAGPVRSLTHWGVPAGAELSLSVLTAPDVAEVALVVTEHHLRPREVIGAYFFQRADSLVPNARVGSDRVVQRTMVRVPVTRFGSIEALLPG